MQGMRVVRVVACGLAVLAMVASVQARVLDLRELAAGEASLVHQWTFEGSSDAERRQDSAGGANLGQIGSGAAPALDTGFDSSSRSAQFFGAAAFKSSAFDHPNTATVEYLYRADNPGAGHIVSAVGNSTNRLYYGVGNAGDDGVAFGNGGWPNPFSAFLTGSTTPDLETGHWYYVAVTQQRSGSTITANAYLADLSEGQTTLTHALSNVTKPAANTNYGSNTLGIGMQGNATGGFFRGMIDEVAYYNALLSQQTLQEHLDALHRHNGVQTVTGAGDADAMIHSGKPDTAYPTHTYLRVARATDTAQDLGAGTKRDLFHFDLDDVPQNAHVISANIRLYQTDSSVVSGVELHEVTGGWAETVTWNTAPAFDPTPLDTRTLDSNTDSLGSTTFANDAILDMARRWTSGQTPNNGVILKFANDLTGGNGDTIASREQGNLPAPSATVSYMFGQIIDDCPVTDDAIVHSGRPDVNFGSTSNLRVAGSSDTTNGGEGVKRAFLKFDLSTISPEATVSNAVLRIYQMDAYADADGYRVLAIAGDWDEGTITWDTMPSAGTELGHLFVQGEADALFQDIDLTDLVQDWVSRDQPNFGIALQKWTEAGGGDTFASKENSTFYSARLFVAHNIPEPATLALLGLGLAALARRRR